jgi:hypothetical protein
MGNRLTGLSEPAFNAAVAELNDIAARMTKIASIIDPAYGVKWCDHALKIYRETLTLRGRVEDKYYRQSTSKGGTF